MGPRPARRRRQPGRLQRGAVRCGRGRDGVGGPLVWPVPAEGAHGRGVGRRPRRGRGARCGGFPRHRPAARRVRGGALRRRLRPPLRPAVLRRRHDGLDRLFLHLVARRLLRPPAVVDPLRDRRRGLGAPAVADGAQGEPGVHPAAYPAGTDRPGRGARGGGRGRPVPRRRPGAAAAAQEAPAGRRVGAADRGTARRRACASRRPGCAGTWSTCSWPSTRSR